MWCPRPGLGANIPLPRGTPWSVPGRRRGRCPPSHGDAWGQGSPLQKKGDLLGVQCQVGCQHQEGCPAWPWGKHQQSQSWGPETEGASSRCPIPAPGGWWPLAPGRSPQQRPSPPRTLRVHPAFPSSSLSRPAPEAWRGADTLTSFSLSTPLFPGLCLFPSFICSCDDRHVCQR